MNQKTASAPTQPDAQPENRRPSSRKVLLPAVMAGTDGSAGGSAAVEWAAEEAVRRRWALLVVYVCELRGAGHPEPCRAGHQLLASAAAVAVAAAPDVEITTKLLHGRPEECLRSAFGDVSMAVIGSRKLGQIRQAVLGTVTSALASDAAAPLVIVHASESGRPDGPVVVGCDAAGNSGAAIELAFAEAQSRGADLVAVYSWRNTLVDSAFPYVPPLMLDLSQLEGDARDALAAILTDARTKYPKVRVRTVVTSQGPVPTLLDLGAQAQLLVVGTRGRGALSGLLFGSTSQALVSHMTCPVVVVPPAENQEMSA